MTPAQAKKAIPSDDQVVGKAVLKAAGYLGINNRILSKIIGISEPSVSRLANGTFTLSEKPFELSVLLIRLYRSLDAIVGGDHEVARSWLRNRNTALAGVPIELIQRISGLTDVIAYLDARRAVV
ncbi:MAG: MbcA/ParS/Xre antitoxin family protein [Beijerinckiaceae bacterium]|nr:MbcA/ParS/Xre antitoxin family protein [Beijerinckiaceae bacterium]